MPLTNAYLDTSQVVNLGRNANDGTGDNIRAAFTKVNYTFANIQTFLLTTTNFTSANVYQNLYAFSGNIPTLISSNIVVTGASAITANTGALQVNGGSSLNGNVYIPAGSTLYVGGSPVATSAATFTGGNVPGTVVFQNAGDSTSPTTGAVVISGGLGIGANVYTAKNITAVGSITGASFTGTSVTGTLLTANQPNITTTGTLSNLVVAGTSTLTGGVITSTLSAATSISTTGQVTASGGINGTLLTGAQPNLVTAGQLSAVSLNNTPIGNTTPSTAGFTNVTAGNITVTGNITTATMTATNAYITGTLFVAGNTTTVNSTTISTNDLNVILASNAGSAGAANGAGIIVGGAGVGFQYNSATNAFQPNISIMPAADNAVTSGSATQRWSAVYGTSVNATTINVSGSVLPTSNVAVNLGSTSLWFNNIYGTAIHAQYADLAERYDADAEYEPGTVVVFGGDKEITTTQTYADPSVAGVISTDPAYLMNDLSTGLAVALRGKVPCKVLGPVKKGDLLVSSVQAGYAVSVGKDQSMPLAVFGKSLETNLDDGAKIIYAVII